MKTYKIIGDGQQRLDALIAKEAPVTRARGAQLIKEGFCTVDGKLEKKVSARPLAGQEIILTLPKAPKEQPLVPQAISLDILYEDEDLLAVNKPSGMVVHPGAGVTENTLVNALIYHTPFLSSLGGEKRPGIVHRLDKDTSGVLLVAKNDETHQELSRQLKMREMEKHYCAVVHGKMKPKGEVIAPIARSKKDRKKMAVDPLGRSAITYWTLLNEKGAISRVDINLITGRTHQIRVHMAYIGHPVVGDVLYGRKEKKAQRLMLHAWQVSFVHPKTKEKMVIAAPLPEVFVSFM